MFVISWYNKKRSCFFRDPRLQPMLPLFIPDKNSGYGRAGRETQSGYNRHLNNLSLDCSKI